MIIFLYGPDDYRRHERKQFYIREYQKKHSNLGIGRFDFGEEGAIEKFREFTRAGSIFDPYKLAIAEHVFDAEGEAAAELKHLKDSDKETTIVISENQKPTKNFSFLLKDPVIAEEFEALEGYAWEMFVRKEAKRWGVNATDDTILFLANVYRGDSWRMATELQKLSLLGEQSISTKDLESLGLEFSPDTWALITSFKSGDRKRRLHALEALLAAHEPPQKIFYILSSQQHEYRAAFAAYDLAIKSGKLDYEEALIDLAIS